MHTVTAKVVMIYSLPDFNEINSSILKVCVANILCHRDLGRLRPLLLPCTSQWGSGQNSQHRHGALHRKRPPRPVDRPVQVFTNRLVFQPKFGGDGANYIFRGVWAAWWRRRRVLPWQQHGSDIHQCNCGGEDRLLPNDSEPTARSSFILRGDPKSVVWRHGSHVTTCEWSYKRTPWYFWLFSATTCKKPCVPQVHQFQAEDQIISHLAAKSASAYVLFRLYQSVSFHCIPTEV